MTRAGVVLNRGPWTAEEDILLKRYIEVNGVGRWSTLPQKAGLMRCGKSCRLRWMNHLRPNVKHGHISPDEEDLIIRLHNLLGNRWSLIAGRVPGRTDNEVKNYWNTHLSKKLARKSFARCKTVAQIVQGRSLSCVNHQKSKAKAMINSLDDHTLKSRSKNRSAMNAVVPDNFRFASSSVSPTDSTAIPLHLKQDYSVALPDSQSVDATVKCIVTELPSSDRKNTIPATLEDDFGRAEDELHTSMAPSVVEMNMEQDMADFLPISRFEQSISGTELCPDSFISSWPTWFDSLFWENDFA